MGFSSWLCHGCDLSIRVGSQPPQSNWMQHVVVVAESGPVWEGVYDGYGRLGSSKAEVESLPWLRHETPTTAVLNNGADWERREAGLPSEWIGPFTIYHAACWRILGEPGFAGQSPYAEDQGHFTDFNPPEPHTRHDLEMLHVMADRGVPPPRRASVEELRAMFAPKRKTTKKKPAKRRVRGLGGLDANTLEQWNGKRFRKPDVFDGRSAAWYGPDGPDGEHATVATSDDVGVIVWEYTYVVGLIEDPYADYAVTKTHLSYDDIEQAVGTIWSARGRASALFLQWAASIGVAKLAYHGGEESWANQLPR